MEVVEFRGAHVVLKTGSSFGNSLCCCMIFPRRTKLHKTQSSRIVHLTMVGFSHPPAICDKVRERREFKLFAIEGQILADKI